ncbi:MAG: arsenate reductase, partial [Marinobacter sp.]
EFHDFKKDGLTSEKLSQWEQAIGWETLINKRGTTWRKLPDELRDTINAQNAHQIMLENTSIIKRPVVERGDEVTVGFNADQWSTWTD